MKITLALLGWQVGRLECNQEVEESEGGLVVGLLQLATCWHGQADQEGGIPLVVRTWAQEVVSQVSALLRVSKQPSS